MADAGQFAKDADILLRVGTKASATVKAAGWFDTWRVPHGMHDLLNFSQPPGHCFKLSHCLPVQA